MAQGSTKKSRNKKMASTYHNDAMTSVHSNTVPLVHYSHGIVMMSVNKAFSGLLTFWCFLGPFLDLTVW